LPTLPVLSSSPFIARSLSRSGLRVPATTGREIEEAAAGYCKDRTEPTLGVCALPWALL
jgi:hypothetical protein